MRAGAAEAPAAALRQRILSPRSIAVIGASEQPDKPGNRLLRHLAEGGFRGQVWPVNPRGGRWGELAFFTSVKELPGAPDLVFLSVPAERTEDALRDCVACGPAAVILGASGFSELGTEEGADRERRLAAIALDAGARLIGPNTNGLVSAPAGVALGFNRRFPEAAHAPGPVSVVSHSGALFDAAVLPLLETGTGIARFLALGNEADVDLSEALDWLARDEATRVVGLIVEALGDAERFRDAARRAAEGGKRVVGLKVGRSNAGAKAALAHSSRIAGDARLYEALFAASGVISTPSVEAFAATLSLLARYPDWDGRPEPLLCVTTSGAGGALLADAAEARGLPLATGAGGAWPPAIQKKVAGLVPHPPLRHPIDLGTLGDWSPLAPVLDALAPHEAGPLVAFAHTPPGERMAANLRAGLAGRLAAVTSPVVLLSPGGLPEAGEWRQAGLPTFRDTGSVMDALAAIASAPDHPAPAVRTPAPELERAEAVGHALAEARRGGHASLTETESTAILARMGLPFAESRYAADLEAAATAAVDLGFPVVLKGQVPGLAHKVEAGLVRLDLPDADAVRAAAAGMAARHPKAGFLVQSMQRPEVEALVAVVRDPRLGVFVMFGIGGAGVERAGAELMPYPAHATEIAARIAASPLGELVAARLAGAAEAAMAGLTAALVGLGRLALEQPHAIRAAEINPMAVTAQGACLGLDALVECAEGEVP